MKSLISNTIKTTLVLTAALALTACSQTPRAPTYNVTANVINVVSAPEVCLVNQTKSKNNASKNIIYTALGGIIGNQFGSGSGKAIMTGSGALAGYAISQNSRTKSDGKLKCSSNGYVATVAYIHPQSRQMVTDKISLTRKTRAKQIVIPVKGFIVTQNKI